MESDQREDRATVLARKAEELLAKLNNDGNPESRKYMVAFALACAGFEAAFEVWEERFELMKDLLEKYPPPPRRPPDFGSSGKSRRCWWCGGDK